MYKKIKKSILWTAVLTAALLLMLIPGMALASVDVTFQEATVTEADVNLRVRPTTDSPVVTQLAEGTRVGVFCEETEGWYRVIYGNYRGYLSTEYVFMPGENVVYGNVITDGAAVRANPADYSAGESRLSAGTGVKITNIVGGFYEIEYGDELSIGYMAKEDIQTSKATKAATLYKVGMTGAEVSNMQRELKNRGFFAGSVTGYFGDQTEKALKLFQKEAGVSQDGVAGEATLELLYGDNDIKITAAERIGLSGEVQLSHWDTIKNVFKRYSYATVTDVRTGISYRVYRFGGWHHADCEPVTPEDTAKMKKAYGGSWSWDRRAIWVTIGSKTYAASQNGMPHMANPSSTNNFDGHFCIHFNGSLVHENNKECSRHQSMVQYAYRKGNST